MRNLTLPNSTSEYVIVKENMIVAPGGAVYRGALLAAREEFARATLHNGTGPASPVIASLAPRPSGFETDSCDGDGLPCPEGIYVNLIGDGVSVVVEIKSRKTKTDAALAGA